MNEILESRIGKFFVIFYALLALIVYGYVFFCGESYCASYIIVPILPWAYIIVRDLGFVFPWMLYPIFVLVNASVAYVLGATIEWSYNRYIDHKEGKKLKILQQKKNNFFKKI